MYYGEIDMNSGLPHGNGVILFKHDVSAYKQYSSTYRSVNRTNGLNSYASLTPTLVSSAAQCVIDSTTAANTASSISNSGYNNNNNNNNNNGNNTLLHDMPSMIGARRVACSTSKLNTSAYQQGDRYGGSWANGLFDGEGLLIANTFTYHGTWSEGKPHGKGVMKYSKNYVDRMPGSGGIFDLPVSTLLLRGLTYLSPFDDSAHKPREYAGMFHKVHLRHGEGIMTYYNGDVYEGEWANNRRHGQGKLRKTNGEIRVGAWERDELHGYAKISYANGALFKGMLAHNKRNGEGVMGFANGDEYYGNFSEDKIDGLGTMRYKNGDVYEGEWHDGVRQGKGKYTLKRNAVTVEGSFIKGLIHGNGTVHVPNVSTFVGVFDRGERVHGTIFWHSSLSNESTTNNNNINNNVDDHNSNSNNNNNNNNNNTDNTTTTTTTTVTTTTTKEVDNEDTNKADDSKETSVMLLQNKSTSTETKLCYQGEWAGELRHGKGLLWFVDGSFYYGTFYKSYRHGKGNMRFADGSEYSGEFVRDKRHGWGIEQSVDGAIQAGRWSDDIFVEGYEGEWDGQALNGVGHLRISVERYLARQSKSNELEFDANTKHNRKRDERDAHTSASTTTPFTSPSASPRCTLINSSDNNNNNNNIIINNKNNQNYTNTSNNNNNNNNNNNIMYTSSSMIDFFGIFRNGVRDGSGILKLPAIGGVCNEVYNYVNKNSMLTQQTPSTPENNFLMTSTLPTDAAWRVKQSNTFTTDRPNVSNLKTKKSNNNNNNNLKMEDHNNKNLLVRPHIMKGRWVRDVMSCERGVWAFPTGEVYVGGFHDNARQSQTGWMWLPDSSVFVGSWKCDAPYGYGVFYAKNINDPILRCIHDRTWRETKNLHTSVNDTEITNTSHMNSVEHNNAYNNNNIKDNDHNNSSGATTKLLSVNFLWNIFRRNSTELHEEVLEKRQHDDNAVTEDSHHAEQAARVLAGFRDHYVIAGKWNSYWMSTTMFKSIVIPVIASNNAAILSSGLDSSSQLRPLSSPQLSNVTHETNTLTPMTDNNMYSGTMYDKIMYDFGSNENNNNNSNNKNNNKFHVSSLEVAALSKQRATNSKSDIISFPPHITTGVKTSSGVVIYPSGVIVREEWLRNYPKLAVPYRPGSNYDVFLRWLNIYVDRQYNARLRCPSLHSALSTVLNEYAQKTGEQRVRGYGQSVILRDQHTLWQAEQSNSTSEINNIKINNSNNNNNQKDVNVQLHSTSKLPEQCAFCGKEFGFFRRPAQCALCFRSSCTACLTSMETFTRPDITALVSQSSALLSEIESNGGSLSLHFFETAQNTNDAEKPTATEATSVTNDANEQFEENEEQQSTKRKLEETSYEPSSLKLQSEELHTNELYHQNSSSSSSSNHRNSNKETNVKYMSRSNKEQSVSKEYSQCQQSESYMEHFEKMSEPPSVVSVCADCIRCVNVLELRQCTMWIPISLFESVLPRERESEQEVTISRQSVFSKILELPEGKADDHKNKENTVHAETEEEPQSTAAHLTNDDSTDNVIAPLSSEPQIVVCDNVNSSRCPTPSKEYVQPMVSNGMECTTTLHHNPLSDDALSHSENAAQNLLSNLIKPTSEQSNVVNSETKAAVTTNVNLLATEPTEQSSIPSISLQPPLESSTDAPPSLSVHFTPEVKDAIKVEREVTTLTHNNNNNHNTSSNLENNSTDAEEHLPNMAVNEMHDNTERSAVNKPLLDNFVATRAGETTELPATSEVNKLQIEQESKEKEKISSEIPVVHPMPTYSHSDRHNELTHNANDHANEKKKSEDNNDTSDNDKRNNDNAQHHKPAALIPITTNQRVEEQETVSSNKQLSKEPLAYVVYYGYVSHELPHLWGEMWWGHTHYYAGEFKHGVRSGYGMQIMGNGEKYIGMFKHNNWHGVGNYFCDDGSVIQGTFARNKLKHVYYHGELDQQLRRHGRGVSYEYDGSSYNGEWAHNIREGTGLLQCASGMTYSGSFVSGQPHGHGKSITEQSVYYGQFENGLKHGTGVEFFAECAVEGTWQNGVSHGFCRIHDALTHEVHETTYCKGNERDDCFARNAMVNDRAVMECVRCGKPFGMFLRRHHCRLCGNVFCDSCTQQRANLPSHFYLSPTTTVLPILANTGTGFTNSSTNSTATMNSMLERVCNECFLRLQQRRMLVVKRYASGAIYAGCWSHRRPVSRGIYCRTDGLCIVMNEHGQPLVPSSAYKFDTDANAAQETLTPHVTKMNMPHVGSTSSNNNNNGGGVEDSNHHENANATEWPSLSASPTSPSLTKEIASQPVTGKEEKSNVIHLTNHHSENAVNVAANTVTTSKINNAHTIGANNRMTVIIDVNGEKSALQDASPSFAELNKLLSGSSAKDIDAFVIWWATMVSRCNLSVVLDIPLLQHYFRSQHNHSNIRNVPDGNAVPHSVRIDNNIINTTTTITGNHGLERHEENELMAVNREMLRYPAIPHTSVPKLFVTFSDVRKDFAAVAKETSIERQARLIGGSPLTCRQHDECTSSSSSSSSLRKLTHTNPEHRKATQGAKDTESYLPLKTVQSDSRNVNDYNNSNNDNDHSNDEDHHSNEEKNNTVQVTSPLPLETSSAENKLKTRSMSSAMMNADDVTEAAALRAAQFTPAIIPSPPSVPHVQLPDVHSKPTRHSVTRLTTCSEIERVFSVPQLHDYDITDEELLNAIRTERQKYFTDNAEAEEKAAINEEATATSSVDAKNNDMVHVYSRSSRVPLLASTPLPPKPNTNAKVYWDEWDVHGIPRICGCQMGKPILTSTKTIVSQATSGNVEKESSPISDVNTSKNNNNNNNNNNNSNNGNVGPNTYTSKSKSVNINVGDNETVEINVQQIGESNEKPYLSCPFWRPVVPPMQDALEAGKFERASRLMNRCEYAYEHNSANASHKESIVLKGAEKRNADVQSEDIDNKKQNDEKLAKNEVHIIRDNNSSDYHRNGSSSSNSNSENDNEEMELREIYCNTVENDDEDDEDVVFAPKLYACGVPRSAIASNISGSLPCKQDKLQRTKQKKNAATTNVPFADSWLPVAMKGPFEFDIHAGKAKVKKSATFLATVRER